MKKILIVLLAAVILTACASSPEAADPQDASKSNHRVDVMCNLRKGPAEAVTVTQNANTILFWNWTAATQEQVQAYIDQSQIVVTLDGQPITTARQSKIRQTTSGKFLVSWAANAGKLSPGIHTTTYNVAWKAQITDGVNLFGPGSPTEAQSSVCGFVVQ